MNSSINLSYSIWIFSTKDDSPIFVRISNKSLINEISSILKEDINGKKFNVSYNSKDKIIEIDLNDSL